MKLNLGCGPCPIDGYVNVDKREGGEAFPLAYPDDAADEIRASHILEHFGYEKTLDVLVEWARVLRPGGVLKIAVPDFDAIVRAYEAGIDAPIEGVLMGGHLDEHDRHKAIFNEQKLTALMQGAGLVDIKPWGSEINDCAAKNTSLNLCGRKPETVPADRPCGETVPVSLPVQAAALAVSPATVGLADTGSKVAVPSPPAKALKVSAVMSVPRLGFMDFFFCAFRALAPYKVPIRRCTGAFWGQCLTRAMLETIESDKPDVILTMDYDSVFTKADFENLIKLVIQHPEADAIAAMQSARTREKTLMTIKGTDGKNVDRVKMELLQAPLLRCNTAHFGLTAIRVDKLLQLPQPWFKGEPGPTGLWDDSRTDDDISFWRSWEKEGFSLYQANHVICGHAELMVRWPGQDLSVIYQHPYDFWKGYGKPVEAWQ